MGGTRRLVHHGLSSIERGWVEAAGPAKRKKRSVFGDDQHWDGGSTDEISRSRAQRKEKTGMSCTFLEAYPWKKMRFRGPPQKTGANGETDDKIASD